MDCSLAIVSKYSKYMFYQVFAAILHLIMGHGNLMWYHVSLELHLHEWYQARPVEAISEEDWQHIDVDHDNSFW